MSDTSALKLNPKPGETFRVNRLLCTPTRIAEAAYRNKLKMDKKHGASQYAAAIMLHNKDIADPKNPKLWTAKHLLQTVKNLKIPATAAVPELMTQARAQKIRAPLRVVNAQLAKKLPAHPSQLSGEFAPLGAFFKKIQALRSHMESHTKIAKQLERILAAGKAVSAYVDYKVVLGGGSKWEKCVDWDVFKKGIFTRRERSVPRVKLKMDARLAQVEKELLYTHDDVEEALKTSWDYRIVRDKLAKQAVDLLKNDDPHTFHPALHSLMLLFDSGSSKVGEWLLTWLSHAFQTLAETRPGHDFVVGRLAVAFLKVRKVGPDKLSTLNESEEIFLKLLKYSITTAKIAKKATPHIPTAISFLGHMWRFVSKIPGFIGSPRSHLSDAATTSINAARAAWNTVKNELAEAVKDSVVFYLHRKYLKFRLSRVDPLKILQGTVKEFDPELFKQARKWQERLHELETRAGAPLSVIELQRGKLAEMPGWTDDAVLALEGALVFLNTIMAFAKFEQAFRDGTSSAKADAVVDLVKLAGDVAGLAYGIQEHALKIRHAQAGIEATAAETALKPIKSAAAKVAVVFAVLDLGYTLYKFYKATADGGKMNWQVAGSVAGLVGSLLTLAGTATTIPGLQAVGLAIALAAAAIGLVVAFWDKIVENPSSIALRTKMQAYEKEAQQTPWWLDDRESIKFRPRLWFEQSSEGSITCHAQCLYPYKTYDELFAAFPRLQQKHPGEKTFFFKLKSSQGVVSAHHPHGILDENGKNQIYRGNVELSPGALFSSFYPHPHYSKKLLPGARMHSPLSVALKGAEAGAALQGSIHYMRFKVGSRYQGESDALSQTFNRILVPASAISAGRINPNKCRVTSGSGPDSIHIKEILFSKTSDGSKPLGAGCYFSYREEGDEEYVIDQKVYMVVKFAGSLKTFVEEGNKISVKFTAIEDDGRFGIDDKSEQTYTSLNASEKAGNYCYRELKDSAIFEMVAKYGKDEKEEILNVGFEVEVELKSPEGKVLKTLEVPNKSGTININHKDVGLGSVGFYRTADLSQRVKTGEKFTYYCADGDEDYRIDQTVYMVARLTGPLQKFLAKDKNAVRVTLTAIEHDSAIVNNDKSVKKYDKLNSSELKGGYCYAKLSDGWIYELVARHGLDEDESQLKVSVDAHLELRSSKGEVYRSFKARRKTTKYILIDKR